MLGSAGSTGIISIAVKPLSSRTSRAQQTQSTSIRISQQRCDDFSDGEYKADIFYSPSPWLLPMVLQQMLPKTPCLRIKYMVPRF